MSDVVNSVACFSFWSLVLLLVVLIGVMFFIVFMETVNFIRMDKEMKEEEAERRRRSLERINAIGETDESR